MPRSTTCALTATLLAFVAVSGCGGSTEVRTVVETVATQAASPARPAPATRHVASVSASHQVSPPSRFKRCDANITAERGTTTCAFAQNVFYEYWTSDQAESLRAYSPPMAKTYDVQCVAGEGQVACEAGDGATLRFPQEAVDAYTQSQADAYAASHDVGTATAPSTPPTESGSGDGQSASSPNDADGDGCHDSYEGACLDPNSSDYDCAGGSGDGPDYVDGPVEVVGYDEYDLDRNGTGVGCQS